MVVGKEGWKTIKINKDLYSLQAIYNAAYTFLGKAYIVIDEDEKYYIVYVKSKGEASLDNIELEFGNQLINYERYFASLKENNEVAKLIIQRALFSSSPRFIQEAEEKEIEELIKELEAEDE